MELLPLPGVGLMVVALGALDLHAEEDARDLARHLDRLGLVRQREIDRAVLVVATGGGDQVRRHGVPRPVRGELLGEPRLELRIADLVPVLVRRVVEDHVAPVARPVGGIIRALQQVVDQRGTLALALRSGRTRGPAPGWAACPSRRDRRDARTPRRSSAGRRGSWSVASSFSSMASIAAASSVGGVTVLAGPGGDRGVDSDLPRHRPHVVADGRLQLLEGLDDLSSPFPRARRPGRRAPGRGRAPGSPRPARATVLHRRDSLPSPNRPFGSRPIAARSPPQPGPAAPAGRPRTLAFEFAIYTSVNPGTLAQVSVVSKKQARSGARGHGSRAS